MESAAVTTLPPATDAWRWFRPSVWGFALLGAGLWLPGFRENDWLIVAALILVGNVIDMMAVRIQAGMRVSATHFAAPFAIIATSVGGGIVVAALCIAGRLIFHRRDWNAFDVAVNVAAASIAGATWQLSLLVPGESLIVSSIATIVVFAAARSIVNYGWSLEARARGIRIPAVSMPIGRLMIASALLFTPAIALFAEHRGGPVNAAILLLLPFFATQFLVRAFGRERGLFTELEVANLSLTESLVNALDARDPYSAGHSLSVAVYARDLAAEVTLSPAECQRIYLAGLLHDIGKIAVPDAILRKPSALTDEEFHEIREHPETGERILQPSHHLRDLLPAIRHHHERIDGKGYPDNLRDEQIPLQARIVAVADAYNAMTSSRPYRNAMSPELALRVLAQNQGAQHDPYLVTAFTRLITARGDQYARAIGADFEPSRWLVEVLASASSDRNLADKAA